MMLAELTELLAHVPSGSRSADFGLATIDENVLGKATASTRRLTHQRLVELYGLDPSVPLFRILGRLWGIETAARPQLALLCALARDPLLRATADVVLDLAPGQELSRARMLETLQGATGDRLNEAVSDKVARNTASTWTQSGHLAGRVRKVRQHVRGTAAAMALALWLGWVEGRTGELLLRSSWARVLDESPSELLQLAIQAKQMGLVRLRLAGGVVEIDPSVLDPLQALAR